ncbi:15770_t:CDS:2 [Entrophospora sp. SA101]|nr:15770_t:CDS:2 [Entrophospora sp. SA101]
MDNVRCLICSRRLKSQDSLLLHVKSAHLNAPNNTNKKAKRKPKRRNGNDNSDDRDDNGNGIDEIKKGDKDRNLIIIDDDDEWEEREIDNDSNDNDMSTSMNIINDNDMGMGMSTSTINDKVQDIKEISINNNNSNIQIQIQIQNKKQENDISDNSNSNIHNQNIKNIITTSTKGKETINQSNNIIEIYPQFPCEMCNASFSSLLELSNHIDSNHPEAYHPILITCPGCKEVNHNRYSFSRHKRLVHNMKGPLNKVQHSNQTNNQTQNPHAIPNINSPGLNNNNNTYTNSGSLPHNNHINNFSPINNFLTLSI